MKIDNLQKKIELTYKDMKDYEILRELMPAEVNLNGEIVSIGEASVKEGVKALFFMNNDLDMESLKGYQVITQIPGKEEFVNEIQGVLNE